MGVYSNNIQMQTALTQTQELASFVSQLKYEDLATSVTEFSKEHLLDALGIAIASSAFDFGKVTLNGVRSMGEGGPATAIGSGVSLNAPG